MLELFLNRRIRSDDGYYGVQPGRRGTASQRIRREEGQDQQNQAEEN
jgi:hypothetical protein